MKLLTSSLAGHQRAIGGNCHTQKNLPEAKLESKRIPRFYVSGCPEQGGGKGNSSIFDNFIFLVDDF